MENRTHSPAFLKRRKFLTVIPLLVLPFISFAFWALGGGKDTPSSTDSAATGFNVDLPGAHLNDDKAMDKMSYYDQVGKDSAKINELKKSDPYYNYQLQADSSFPDLSLDATTFAQDSFAVAAPKPRSGLKGLSNTDANEQKVYQRLDRLNAALAQHAQTSTQEEDTYTPEIRTDGNDTDIQKLQQMMQAANQTGEPDPEMQQIDGMLEKIMDVQNPGRVQEKLRKASESKKGRVFAVVQGKPTDPVSSLGQKKEAAEQTQSTNQPNGFYSFNNSVAGSGDQNAISAVIHESQTLTTGSTVKLRLTNDVYINGVLIPKGNFVFGIAALNGERLTVKIPGIRYRNNLFPVELSVFDMDGLDGIYIPGAISREVAKESADQGLQNIGLNSVDPSIGIQAAGVGVEAAKSLLSKKVKLIRVTVKAGYMVLLRDEKQKQQD